MGHGGGAFLDARRGAFAGGGGVALLSERRGECIMQAAAPARHPPTTHAQHTPHLQSAVESCTRTATPGASCVPNSASKPRGSRTARARYALSAAVHADSFAARVEWSSGRYNMHALHQASLQGQDSAMAANTGLSNITIYDKTDGSSVGPQGKGSACSCCHIDTVLQQPHHWQTHLDPSPRQLDQPHTHPPAAVPGW